MTNPISFIHIYIVVGLLISAATANAADLTVVVENVKSAEGTVRVGLFNKPETFPKTPLKGQSLEAKVGSAYFVFKDLEPGNYAISAFHDVNRNQKLDTNSVGIPNEPYGFSRDAQSKFGPPSFNDARIVVDTKPQRISVYLQ